MSRIEHVAVWTSSPERLEALRAFYETHFGARATAPTPYRSARRAGFASYFLRFPAAGARLELMTLPALAARPVDEALGWAHVAIALGSREAVDACVARLAAAGVEVAAPRETGDGYYEAVARDPDGNVVEIMA